MQVIAESWATAGASGIVITGRNVDVLEEIATQLRSASPGTKVLAQAADITKEDSVAALFAAAKDAVGKIDVLINTAGSLAAGPVGTTDPTTFFNDFQVNVLGTYIVTHQFLAQADGAGTVVTFTTGAIASVFPGMGGYTASKLATVRVMENLHAENPNIRVFSLNPGIVLSSMTLDALKPYAKDSPGLSASWTLFLSTLAPSNAPLFSSSILAPQKGITRNQGLSFYFQYLGYSDNTLLSPEAEVHCVIRILY